MQSSGNSSHKLPAKYASVKYDDVPENIKKILRAMSTGGKGLYLYGDCGTGKTHIAYAIWEKSRKLGRLAKIYNSPEMFDVIRDFYGKKGVDYRDNELKMLIDFEGILIIDDVGAEKPTEWVAETFYKIVNVRYEKQLPTIFTSNLSLDGLAEQIGDRIASRIAEMCEVIKLKGNDRRLG